MTWFNNAKKWVADTARKAYNAVVRPVANSLNTVKSAGRQANRDVTAPRPVTRPKPTPVKKPVPRPAAKPSARPTVSPSIPAQPSTVASRMANLAGKIEAFKNAITGGLRRTGQAIGHVAATPIRYSEKWNEKRVSADQLGRSSKWVSDSMDARIKQAEKTVAKARDDVYSGKIRPEDYDRIVDKEDRHVKFMAKTWTDYFDKESRKIASPIPQGKGTKAVLRLTDFLTKNPISKGIWKYTLGEGSKNMPSVVTAPKRVMHLLRNEYYKKAPRYYSDPKLQEEWDKAHRPTKEQVLNSGQTMKAYSGGGKGVSVFRRFGEAWRDTYRQELADPNTVSGSIGNMAVDPFNVLPAEWGPTLAAKGGKMLSKSSTFKSVSNVLSKAGRKTKAADAWKWLNTEATSFSQKLRKSQLDRDVKRLTATKEGKAIASRYKWDLTDDEARYFQLARYKGDAFDWSTVPKNVNRRKIESLVKSQKARDAEFFRLEKGAGQNYGKMEGYVPNAESIASKLKKGMKLTDDEKLFYTYSKKKVEIQSAQQLMQSYILREVMHQANLPKRSKVLSTVGAKALKESGGFSADSVSKALKVSKNPLNWDRADWRVAGNSVGKGFEDVFHAPTRLWKKSVLKYRPSWYVNNVAWNVPASFLAGGKDTLKGYGKILKGAIKEKTLSPGIIEAMPEGVVNRAMMGGELRGAKGARTFGEKLENLSRGAAYLGAKANGFDEAASIKRVNRYLFDYTTSKNWERPIRTAMPFWTWQKNITRLTGQLPFTNPRAAVAFNNFRKYFMERPLNELPDKTIEWKDPDTGETVTYNPREAREGKIKVGNKWISAPWLPVMPEQLERMGVSPWLSLFKEMATGKDYFGNNVYGKTLSNRMANLFPQADLIGTAGRALNSKPEDLTDRWISASGYTKSKQGYDSSRANYSKDLDPREELKRKGKSFVWSTWGSGKEFDRKDWDEKQRYRGFSDEFFRAGFDSIKDFGKRQQAKRDLAKKYGYDLEKDIYGDKWTRYDSDTAKQIKGVRAKERELSDKVSAEYSAIPKGKKRGTGSRTDYIVDLGGRIAKGDFSDLPRFKPFKDTYLDIVSEKGPASGSGKKTSKSAAKTEKIAGSRDFWKKYYDENDKEKRKDLLIENPKIADAYGIDSEKLRKAKVYKEAVRKFPPGKARNDFLKANNAYTRRSAAEWERILKETGKAPEDKLAKDYADHPEIAASQIELINRIIGSFKPVNPTPTRGVETVVKRRDPSKWKKALKNY